MKIIIAGAGIGGLVTAMALHRAGHELVDASFAQAAVAELGPYR